MTDINLEEEASKIEDQMPSSIAVDHEEIQEKLKNLTEEYQVPINEARRAVKKELADDAGIDNVQSGNQIASLGEIDSPDQWLDITAKVVELWESQSDSIAQNGTLADETGQIQFTKWEKSNLQSLSKRKVYKFENVVSDEYEERLSLNINSATEITELDEDIEVRDSSIGFTGAMVDVRNGSGLIKRCTEEDCTRVLQNGRCSEHGDVDGEFDLRIKAILDNGKDVEEVIFDKEATESLTGITLDEAKQMAKDALDTTVVGDQIGEEITGRYYRVSGPAVGRYILVNDFEQLEKMQDTESILIRARSI